MLNYEAAFQAVGTNVSFVWDTIKIKCYLGINSSELEVDDVADDFISEISDHDTDTDANFYIWIKLSKSL